MRIAEFKKKVGLGNGLKKLKTSLKTPRYYITPRCLAYCPATSSDHLLVDAQQELTYTYSIKKEVPINSINDVSI